MNKKWAERLKWLDTKWDATYLQFWLMNDKQPLLLRPFRKEALFISPDAESQDPWFCGVCGHKNDNTEPDCSACGAPKRGRERTAVLKLAGRMPH